MAAENNPPTPVPPSDPVPPPAAPPAPSAELIEKIRKEEKEKLYSEMSELKQRLEALQAETGTKTQEYTRQIADLTNQLSALQKAAKNNFDPVAYAREVADDTRRIISEKHTLEVQAMNDRLTRLENEKTAAHLASVRTQLIAEAKGKIVAPMVRGNTEEELRASAVEAIAEYTRITGSVTPPEAQPAPQPPVPAPIPGAGNIPIVVTGGGAPYAKNREKLLAEIKAKHG